MTTKELADRLNELVEDGHGDKMVIFWSEGLWGSVRQCELGEDKQTIDINTQHD